MNQNSWENNISAGCYQNWFLMLFLKQWTDWLQDWKRLDSLDLAIVILYILRHLGKSHKKKKNIDICLSQNFLRHWFYS